MTQPISARGKHRPAYESIAQQITDLIRDSGLAPGDKLPTEQALAERFGVSRTVIREAIKVLTTTGLVRSRRGSGLYVNAPSALITTAIPLSMTVDPEHVLSLLQFREIIEMQTARIAAQQITPPELRELRKTLEHNQEAAKAHQTERFLQSDFAFHKHIAQASGNPFLVSAVESVFRLQHGAIDAFLGLQGSLTKAATQHRAILTAIKEGDPEAAEQAMYQHLQTVAMAYHSATRRRLLGK